MRATPTRRKLEPTHSVPAGMAATTSVASSGRRSTQHGGTGGDPVIKGEINWSVTKTAQAASKRFCRRFAARF